MELSSTERTSLELATEALVQIRLLASRPMTSASQKAIFDLADAVHNVPAHIAGSAGQREKNVSLPDAAIRLARDAYRRNGLSSKHIDV